MSTRRHFVKQALLSTSAMLVKPTLFAAAKDAGLKLSLAEWSLHRALKAGKLDHLDFPAKAKKRFWN